MANFLMRLFQIKDMPLAQDIVGSILRAVLVLCILWYAALVIVRPMRPALQQAPDTNWGIAEGRADHVAV